MTAGRVALLSILGMVLTAGAVFALVFAPPAPAREAAATTTATAVAAPRVPAPLLLPSSPPVELAEEPPQEAWESAEDVSVIGGDACAAKEVQGWVWVHCGERDAGVKPIGLSMRRGQMVRGTQAAGVLYRSWLVGSVTAYTAVGDAVDVVCEIRDGVEVVAVVEWTDTAAEIVVLGDRRLNKSGAVVAELYSR